MSKEDIPHGENSDQQAELPQPEYGQLRNRFVLRRVVPESNVSHGETAQHSETPHKESSDQKTPSPETSSQNSLIFSPERFASMVSLAPEARQQQFTKNITALQNLTGDVRLVPRNPLAKAGDVVLEIIRFPINPIDNTRHLKESAKKLARKLPFTKNLRFLQETPEEQAITLHTNAQTAEREITTSLSQMRRDALPYDGDNPFIRWIVNNYAKKNINMSAKQALSWFTLGNIPIIGFAISAGKLYIPNVVAPLYDRKFARAAKTLFLTATDFGANLGLSVKGGVMIHDILQLFASHGIAGGLMGLPFSLASNWQILTPYPILLAYNPLFIQGRLDKNDYRKYARHMEGMATMLWNGSAEQQALVRRGVTGMLADYAKSHKENSMEENVTGLTTLMQSEYAALIERLTDENIAIATLQESLSHREPHHHAREHHRIEDEITELSLRNKAHKARLLFIENAYLLIQQTGHMRTN